VQTLNDGTHITQTQMHTKQFRDSQGRTRTERPLIPMRGDAQDSPMVVEITDPLAGVRYTLDVQNKIAHRVAVQSPGGASGGIISNTPWFVANGPVPPPPPSASAVTTRTGTMQAVITQASPATVRALRDTTEEKLPPQTIEGVLAEGVRHTTVIPEGAEGNDRPFSITSETWTSPDLKMVVLSKNNDPRNGESIMKLINISRNEPDPLLFQPPPDYQIVDETAPFTIRYNQ